jgi:hypothetical protein
MQQQNQISPISTSKPSSCSGKVVGWGAGGGGGAWSWDPLSRLRIQRSRGRSLAASRRVTSVQFILSRLMFPGSVSTRANEFGGFSSAFARGIFLAHNTKPL